MDWLTGSTVSAANKALNAAINRKGNETTVGNAMSAIGSAASNIPGIGGFIGAGFEGLGMLGNALWGSNIDESAVKRYENEADAQGGYTSSAGDNDTLLSDWAAYSDMAHIKTSDIGSEGLFSNKATDTKNKINRKIDTANYRAWKNLVESSERVDSNKDRMLAMNSFAGGGLIEAGGTHEENPFGGVQLGVDAQGTPNMVEEGEYVYGDKVFSNRIIVPDDKDKKYPRTFAQKAKALAKESEERPNDPISKRGIEEALNRLFEQQEALKMAEAAEAMKQINNGTNPFALGGRKYAGGGVKGYDVTDIAGLPWQDMVWDDARNRNTVNGLSVKKARSVTVPESYTSNADLTKLRYMPAIGSGVATIIDAFDKPDYSAADRVNAVRITPRTVGTAPSGYYIPYESFAVEPYISKATKSKAATQRAVENNAGGNRAAALAGLLAADAGYYSGISEIGRKAAEYNATQRKAVAAHNTGIDQFIAQQSLQAQTANANNWANVIRDRMTQAQQVAALEQSARNLYDTRRSANLNSFINNLGNIGWEEANRNMARTNPALLYFMDRLGNIGYKG